MKMIKDQLSAIGNRLAHRRKIRRMGADVIPRDRSWEVLLPLSLAWIAIVVMFVRWWLCV